MKITKLKFALAVLLSACSIGYSFAQNVSYDMNGRAYKQKSYAEIEGDPFLLKDWSKGILKLANNQTINGVDLKYDLIDGVLLYKDAKGETMEVADPVTEFKIADGANERLFRSGFKAVGNSTERTFYEVLSDGNIKFVKRFVKTIIEEKQYNSPENAKKIVDKISYFVVKADGTMVPVNKNEKSIIAAIGDKNAELSAYVKSNKLNLKEDGDLLKLFEYYFEISKPKP